jgi:hypothetical protein
MRRRLTLKGIRTLYFFFPDCHIHSSHIRAQLEKSLAGTVLMSRDPTIHSRWNKIGRTGIFPRVNSQKTIDQSSALTWSQHKAKVTSFAEPQLPLANISMWLGATLKWLRIL